MDFLKKILGDDLYKQVEEKVNAHNNDPANKDNQIKIVNLESGEYVSKQKFDSTETELKNTKDLLKTANDTITDLKKNTTDNETLQAKITEHEKTIKTMEADHKAELAKMKKENAIKDSLRNANAKHEDLLISKFDLEKIIVNDDGTITGLDEQIKQVKESYKDLFEEDKKDNFTGLNTHDKKAEPTPPSTLSQGASFAKSMNEESKPQESKFFK